MPFEVQEAPRMVTMTLSGVTTEEDVGALLQGLKSHLQRATAPIAIVIDLTESDNGTAKYRNAIGQFFATAGQIRFGLCAGIAAVAKSEGQNAFLRGILSMGPMPCPYRLFDGQGEAVTWARMRLKATEPRPPA